MTAPVGSIIDDHDDGKATTLGTCLIPGGLFPARSVLMAGQNMGSAVWMIRGNEEKKKKLDGEDLQSDTFTFVSSAIRRRSVPTRVVGLGGLA